MKGYVAKTYGYGTRADNKKGGLEVAFGDFRVPGSRSVLPLHPCVVVQTEAESLLASLPCLQLYGSRDGNQGFTFVPTARRSTFVMTKHLLMIFPGIQNSENIF